MIINTTVKAVSYLYMIFYYYSFIHIVVDYFCHVSFVLFCFSSIDCSLSRIYLQSCCKLCYFCKFIFINHNKECILTLNLTGKVSLITGSSRGLGLSIARQLAQYGSDIVICGRSEESLLKAKKN